MYKIKGLECSYSSISIEEVYGKIFDNEVAFLYSFPNVSAELITNIEKDSEPICFSKCINEEQEEDDDFGFLHSDTSLDLEFRTNPKKKIIYRISKLAEENKNLLKIIGPKEIITKMAEEIIAKHVIFPTKKNKIGLLYKTPEGVCIKNIELPKFEIDICLNYGSSFIEKSDLIINKLKEKKSGLFLLYGEPGCGKSFYIKHLCTKIDRQFIFVPSNMIDSLTSPDIIPLLLQKKTPVLILEDAEKAVISRENSDSSPSLVSTILNLSDGVLGDLMRTSIIVTFNTQKEKIDRALCRKGRLSLEHKFDKLAREDAQKLSDHLNNHLEIREPMSLANIYGINKDNFHTEEKEQTIIGFGRK